MTILTRDEFKAIVTTSASDAAIDLALAAEEEAILGAVGPSGEITERFRGGLSSVMLGYRAAAVIEVVEKFDADRVALDPNDWQLSPDGGSVRRLLDGTHPARRFRGQVEVTYLSAIGIATRKSAQAKLVALDLGASVGNAQGAMTQERIGEWSQSFANTTSPLTVEQQREQILSELSPPRLVYLSAAGHSAVADPVGS